LVAFAASHSGAPLSETAAGAVKHADGDMQESQLQTLEFIGMFTIKTHHFSSYRTGNTDSCPLKRQESLYTYDVTCSAFAKPFLAWKSHKYYKFLGGVCSLSYPACKRQKAGTLHVQVLYAFLRASSQCVVLLSDIRTAIAQSV
jgi:hypothetical protein